MRSTERHEAGSHGVRPTRRALPDLSRGRTPDAGGAAEDRETNEGSARPEADGHGPWADGPPERPDDAHGGPAEPKQHQGPGERRQALDGHAQNEDVVLFFS